MQSETAFHKSRPNHLTLMKNIRKKIWNLAGRAPEFRVARSHHAPALEQSHQAIHFQTENRHIGNARF